jgi:hypothetical protein
MGLPRGCEGAGWTVAGLPSPCGFTEICRLTPFPETSMLVSAVVSVSNGMLCQRDACQGPFPLVTYASFGHAFPLG